MLLRYPLSAHVSMTTEEINYLGEIALSSLLDFLSYLYFFTPVRQLRNWNYLKPGFVIKLRNKWIDDNQGSSWSMFNVCCSHRYQKLQIYSVSLFFRCPCFLWASLIIHHKIEYAPVTLSVAIHCYYTHVLLIQWWGMLENKHSISV